ncbi:MAG TPA: hypothetical protein VMD31_17135 [Opitutaceae bacterium]|nr:hypothetical protein [Opitutaceae bacterium]
MTKPWQILLVLVVIFAAGGVSGGLVAYHIARHSAVRLPPPPEVWVARDIERFGERLALTPAQMEKIKPIVRSNVEELTKLRRQSMRATHDILESLENEIMAELTPEQKVHFQEFVEKRRDAWRRMQEMRGAPAHPGREHPPGAPPQGAPPAPPQPAPATTGA